MPTIFISPQQKISYIFFILVALMIVGLIWGLFVASYGVSITLTPEPEEVDLDMTLKAQPNISPNSDSIQATILENTQEAEEKGQPKSTVSAEDFAEGEVIITNNTASSVNFIATTRFLSPDGLVFRLEKQTYIPAKGKIKAIVRADKMGAAYEIGPSTFTVPNLKSTDLIKKISVVSEKPMTGGLKKAGIIMASDIDGLKKDLSDKLSTKGLTEIESQVSQSNFKIITKSTTLEESCDAKPNEEKTEFTVSEKIKIGAAAFDEKKVLEIALNALKAKIPQGKEFLSYEPTSLSYRLLNYDINKQTADIQIQMRGSMVINSENQILEKSHLRGLNSTEIKNYFSSLKDGDILIKKVQVKFWPPFLKKAPTSLDKINIKITK
ncbi:MAG: hypothetical protein PHG83_03845 [Patescibacteria group bacterium]|nr:hypothetical protein [Patescibacteria group bacterium]